MVDPVAKSRDWGCQPCRAALPFEGQLVAPPWRRPRPLPGSAARPLPGSAARPLPGSAARPLPGSAARPRALAEAGSSPERVAEQLLGVLVEDDTVQSIDGWVVDWLLGAGRVLRYRAAEVAADLLGPAVAGLPAADPRREPLQAALASVLLLLGR